MRKPWPFFRARVALTILLIAHPVLLAFQGRWAFAAIEAALWTVMVWSLLVESERARCLLILEHLSAGPHYGLELVHRSSGELGLGMVYPTLRGMERNGLVISAEGLPVPERGNRPRRYYAITRKGVAWLERSKGA